MARMFRILVTVVLAQFLLAQPSSFEVASVKARPEVIGNAGQEEWNIHPGSVTMRNVRLANVVIWAYNLKAYQLGCPVWMWNERLDISAKTGERTSTPAQREMMQALLAQRFRLVSHRQTKPVKCYVLRVGKNAAKFKRATADKFGVEGDHMTHFLFKTVSLKTFADILWEAFQAPVFDETELEGLYDLGFDLTPYLEKDRTTFDDRMAAMVPAFRDQLGLVIEKAERPIEKFIVDSADKVPSDN